MPFSWGVGGVFITTGHTNAHPGDVLPTVVPLGQVYTSVVQAMVEVSPLGFCMKDTCTKEEETTSCGAFPV